LPTLWREGEKGPKKNTVREIPSMSIKGRKRKEKNMKRHQESTKKERRKERT
jgi:hypothetical protein